MNEFLNQTSLLILTCIFEDRESFLDRILVRLSSDLGSEWTTERASLDLARVYLGRPPRGGSLPLRAVMWTPRKLPDWTAFYINSEDGWTHFFGKLSQAGGPETLSIRSSLPEEKWGVQEFAYRKPGSVPTKPTRLLQWLEEETGYRLVQIGEPLPFEHERAKDINPIATRSDVLSFVRKFGIELEDNEFWKSDADAVYLSQRWLKHL